MAKKSRRELFYQLPHGVGLDELTDEEAGVIWKALDRYQGVRERLGSTVLRLIYNRCCDHIDADHERYDMAIERKRRAANIRWGKKTSNEDAEQSDAMQSNAVHSGGKHSNGEHSNEKHSNAVHSGAIHRNANNHNLNHNLNHNQEPKPSLSEDNDSGNMMMITSADASNIIIDELFKDEWIYEASERLMIPNDEVKAGLKSIASQIVNEGNTYKSRGELMHHIDSWLRKAKRIKSEDEARLSRYNNNNSNQGKNGDRDKFRGIDAVHRNPDEYDEDF